MEADQDNGHIKFAGLDIGDLEARTRGRGRGGFVSQQELQCAAGAAVFAGTEVLVGAGPQADKINAKAMVSTATCKIVLRIIFNSFLICD